MCRQFFLPLFSTIVFLVSSAYGSDYVVTQNGLVDKEGKLHESILITDSESIQTQEILYDFTSKGNGVISYHSSHIRIWDEHNDGIIYDASIPPRLSVRDVTGDDSLEIIFSCVVVFFEEKGDEPIGRQLVTTIFKVHNDGNPGLELIYASDDSLVRRAVAWGLRKADGDRHTTEP